MGIFLFPPAGSTEGLVSQLHLFLAKAPGSITKDCIAPTSQTRPFLECVCLLIADLMGTYTVQMKIK